MGRQCTRLSPPYGTAKPIPFLTECSTASAGIESDRTALTPEEFQRLLSFIQGMILANFFTDIA
jgi:hypothetical protein